LLRKQRKTLGSYFFLPHPVYTNFGTRIFVTWHNCTAAIRWTV